MKKCTICLVEKKFDEFEFERNQCKKCRNKRKHQLVLSKSYEVNVTEKCCQKCKLVKPAEAFSKHIRNPTGLYKFCRECRSIEGKETYLREKDYYKTKAANYYEKHKGTEKINASVRARRKVRMKTDPNYVLKRRLRNRLYYALKKTSWKKNTKFSEYIGCSLDELRKHIEDRFTDGMSWMNQGEWHIDHIIPLDSAQSEEELYKLCNYTNLQPLWAKDNIRKGNKKPSKHCT